MGAWRVAESRGATEVTGLQRNPKLKRGAGAAAIWARGRTEHSAHAHWAVCERCMRRELESAVAIVSGK
eukprot:scaffold63537_cov31-Prasinocladus_malaysianus.AAC.2